MTIEIKDASGSRVMLLGDQAPVGKPGHRSIYIEPTRNDTCVSIGGTFPTCDLLVALDATANTDVKIRADVYAKLTEAEAELRKVKESLSATGRMADAYASRAEAAEAKLARVEEFIASHLDPHHQGSVVAARVAERLRAALADVTAVFSSSHVKLKCRICGRVDEPQALYKVLGPVNP
jgi:hypothetical protein